MEKISGSEALLRTLIAEGVDTIFGYPGGAVIPVYDCLYDYKDKLNEKYDACIFYDPFANAINVNNWISNKTFGIIQNMISDNMVQNKSVKMLLINALAIDMKWNCFFDAINTSGSDFYLEDGSSMDATTMLTKDIPYYMDETVTAVALDLEKYDDVQLEFIAIMPKENLTDYIKTFSKTDFKYV